MREKLRKRSGQTLAIMTALLIPALAVWALTMDLGLVYVRRAEMQRAADAAVLAGAQEFISGGSVETYVRSYLEKNPVGDTVATVERLVINTDAALVDLTIGYQTPSLLLAPNGVGLTVHSGATAELTAPGEIGKPVPPGNAYGWYKKEKSNPGKDSAFARLTS
ncbi:MAG: pilus assembly protein TadG-related protein [Gemmatimonadales bacterium]